MEDEMDEIWALYADDGAQALDAAEEALGKIADGDGSERSDGIASLFRAVHTFKGNSRVLGLQVAESRAHLTEDLIGLVRDQGAPWDDEVESIMQLAVDRLRVILEKTASTRQDADEAFAADLMERLKDKISRITGVEAHAEVIDNPESAVDAPTEILCISEDEAPSFNDLTMVGPSSSLAGAQDGEHSHGVLESLTEVQLTPSAEQNNAAHNNDVLARILDRLGYMNAKSACDERNAILREIAEIAEQEGYRRLADLAEELQSSKANDASQDVRLYEELYAIELSRSDKDIPSPRPHDLLSGWCAEHAFSLIDDLRRAVTDLSDGVEIEAALRLIEPTLRRINAACDYYGLANAAQLSMSLLDLVLRMSSEIGRSKNGTDETVVRMLQTFISTVELSLDAAREGEQPDNSVLEQLSEESGRFEFIRRGAKTAPEALETLKLPAQFLRVMSPRSVLVAENAAAAGMRFFVVAAAFVDGTGQAENFFSMMEDGSVRQITSVSVLSGNEVSFEFLLASNLSRSDLASRIIQVDPTEKHVRLVDIGTPDDRRTQPSKRLANDGVSVEMMEMLGEVSSGLASVIKELRSASESEGRTRLLRALNSTSNPDSLVHRQVQAEFDTVVSRIETSLLAMDHLSRRVTALQEEAMHSRLKPADYILRPLIEQMRAHIRESGQKAELKAHLDPVPLDRQTLEALEEACEEYIVSRLEAGRQMELELSFLLRQRDDRVLLMIQDNLGQRPKQETLDHIDEICALAGGKTAVKTAADQSYRLVISLPTRMLAMEGMVVRSSGIYYVLPVDALLTVVRVPASQIVRRAAAGGKRFLNLEDGEVLQVITLEGGNPDKGGLFLIVQAEGQRRAVLVDELVGQEVIRLRPLQGVMSRLERLAGMAVLAGGEVALVLSPLSLCVDQDLEELAFAAA